MKKLILVAGASTLLSSLFVTSSTAQEASPAVQRLETTGRFHNQQERMLNLKPDQSAPELYPGENEDVGSQRILRLKPRRTNWEAVVDSQYLWSDNVTLASSAGQTDSTIWINTIQGAFAPSTKHSLYGHEISPRIGVRGQWYNYGLDTGNSTLGSFDFHSETIFTEVRYKWDENWSFHLGLDGGRLLNQSDYREFYREIAPNWGTQWRWRIAEDKLFAFNYRGYYHFSETVAPFTPRDINDRHDHSVTLSYNQEILPKLVLQPFYRFQYTAYTGGSSRTDWHNTFGLTASYYLTSWASLRAFASYEIKNSGDQAILPSYRKWDIGMGGSLVFQF